MAESIKGLLVFTVSLATLGAAAATLAQDSAPLLEEIVVTAQKRPESLGDVPISVSVMSGERIDDAGLQNLEDVVAYVPNVVINQQAIGYNINIRGIQSGNQAGFEQSVGTFVDGVYRGRGAQSNFAFLDVEAVEVLRGPQGTLFGRNVIAGALNIRSAQPTRELEGELALAYNPEFDETEITGHLSGPVSESLAVRVAILDRERDEGWLRNTVYNDDIPQVDEQALRLSAIWDIGPASQLGLKAEHGRWDNAGAPYEHILAGPLAALGVEAELDGRTTIGSVQPGSPLNEVFGLPLDSVQEIGSNILVEGDSTELVASYEHSLGGGVLKAIGARSEYDFERLYDADFNPADVASFFEQEDFEQTSLEVRFESDQGGRFEYIAGAYVDDNDLSSQALSVFNLTTIGGLLSVDCALGGGVTVPFNPLTDDSTTALVTAAISNYGATTAAVANSCAQASLINPIVGSGALANADGVTGVTRFARLDQNTQSAAIFAQATYRLNDQWRVTGGVRYTDEEKTARHTTIAGNYARSLSPADPTTLGGQLTIALASLAGEFVPFDTGDQSIDESNLTWSLNTQWEPSDAVMLYAGASTGFKSGGFNTFYFSSDPVATGPQFAEEEVLSFEVGAKSTLADGRAELNVALFRTEYDDLQVSIFSGNTTFEVQNAAEALTQGIEIDARYQATDNLQILGSFGWTDFTFEEFPNQACTNDQFVGFREAIWNDPNNVFAPVHPSLAALLINNGSCAAAGINDLRGRTSSQTPEFSGMLSFDYEKPLDSYSIGATLDLIYRDDTFRQDDLDPLQLDDADVFLNAALRLTLNNGWQFSLIGKNLTDVDDSFEFGNDVPLAAGAQFIGLSAPRSYVLTARYRF